MLRPGLPLLLLVAATLSNALCHAAPVAADVLPHRMSDDARYVAGWVKGSGENQARPFAIVDKREARIYVFEAAGRLVGASAVLLGQTPGDGAAEMADRHPYSLAVSERTTPAGRFSSRPGHNDKGDAIVWIDYAAALAIHRLRPAPAHQRREARLDSATSDDNRISLGCVIVPVGFYDAVVGPTLGRQRGVVYVLPEASSVQAMFGFHDVALNVY